MTWVVLGIVLPLEWVGIFYAAKWLMRRELRQKGYKV